MGLLKLSVIFLLSLITMTLAEPPGCKIRITDRGLEMRKISDNRCNYHLVAYKGLWLLTGFCLTSLQWRPRLRGSWKESWVTSPCQRCVVKRAASSTPSKSMFTLHLLDFPSFTQHVAHRALMWSCTRTVSFRVEHLSEKHKECLFKSSSVPDFELR